MNRRAKKNVTLELALDLTNALATMDTRKKTGPCASLCVQSRVSTGTAVLPGYALAILATNSHTILVPSANLSATACASMDSAANPTNASV